MYYGDESTTNDVEKSNLFAQYFASVYRKHPADDNDDAELLSSDQEPTLAILTYQSPMT